MKWTLERRKVKDLYEYIKNARTLSKDQAAQLHESISKFGQCEPLVINTDGTIIGGHQRLRTMRKMGYKEIEVYTPDEPLSDKEVEELNIRLNRNVGGWDWDVLANAWDIEDLVEWGFTAKDLQVEELPETESADKQQFEKCSMTITFIDVGHLQEAENDIRTISDAYPGSVCKVKVK